MLKRQNQDLGGMGMLDRREFLNLAAAASIAPFNAANTKKRRSVQSATAFPFQQVDVF